MGKVFVYRKYHIFFKGITTLIMFILCATTLRTWNYSGVGITGILLLIFNYFATEKRFPEWDWHRLRTIRIIVNYVFISLLLYYTKMTNAAFIPFYFYMITLTTFYFGIWPGVAIGAVSIMITVIISYVYGAKALLYHLYLYSLAMATGYFAYVEGARNILLDQKVKELKALDKISRIIDEFPETQEILENITKVVAETMNYTASVIMFYDEAKAKLIAKAGHGLSVEELKKISREHRFERYLIDTKETIVTFSGQNEGFIQNKDEACEKQIKFIAAVPLLFRNKIIGTLSIYDGNVKPITEENKELLYMISSRIGIILENDRLYKQVKHNSITDGLTGLYNQRQFYERLRFEIDNAKVENSKLFLLMVDIDRFKSFNDRFGHLVGDKVLVEVARTVKNSIRETDVAARYGGEEFAIILSNGSYETAAIVAERIRYNVKKITEYIDETKAFDVGITVSIGISCYPNCTNDLTNLIDIADVRMYKGKEMGGDQVIA